MAANSYELYYFEFRGRAEVIRLMFHYAGVPFKDNRISVEEWGKIKGDKERFPYGVMPVLFVNNECLAESHVITRYVARITQLDHANDPFENAKLDEIYELGRSFFDAVYSHELICGGWKEGDRQKSYDEEFLPSVEKFFPLIEAKIKSNGWFSERGVSYVDFFWACVVDLFLLWEPETIKERKISIKHMNKVFKLDLLQDYISKRP